MDPQLTRRAFLQGTGASLGAVALSELVRADAGVGLAGRPLQ